MHRLAMKNGQLFFNTYVARLGNVTVVDVGAQDVNGSLREVCPPNAAYIGVDFTEGKGVDVVLDDPYTLPFESNSIDVIVSSSCFEHSEMFWLLFLEISRVLKPDGLFYLNAPSLGGYHRYPVDCYRFFPDSGNALAKWGRRNGLNIAVLEHYTNSILNFGDYVCIFLKDVAHLDRHPKRILDTYREFSHGGLYPNLDVYQMPRSPEYAIRFAPHLA
jgi:SAM-dependent methyltransferase